MICSDKLSLSSRVIIISKISIVNLTIELCYVIISSTTVSLPWFKHATMG